MYKVNCPEFVDEYVFSSHGPSFTSFAVDNMYVIDIRT